MSRRGAGERCHWCRRVMLAQGSIGRLAATVDHVMPQSRGGRSRVWACWWCNHIKADMSPVQWRKFMADYPNWWKGDVFARGREVRRAMLAAHAAMEGVT